MRKHGPGTHYTKDDHQATSNFLLFFYTESYHYGCVFLMLSLDNEVRDSNVLPILYLNVLRF